MTPAVKTLYRKGNPKESIKVDENQLKENPQLLDHYEEKAPAKTTDKEPDPVAFKLQKNGQKWDVVDAEGKAQNTEPMTKADAEKLAKELNEKPKD